MAEEQMLQSESNEEGEKSFDLEVCPEYITEDALIKHITRQSLIVSKALEDKSVLPVSVSELSRVYEKTLFGSGVPKKQPNGTCVPNPSINFYPCFTVPEVLAAYHVFFQNFKIPKSCKANRPKSDNILLLKNGDRLPKYCCLEEVPRIFEGLGKEQLDEVVDAKSLQEENSALIELKSDNPRIAIVKRSIMVTHFAYPATNLPPKVMSTVLEALLFKKVKAVGTEEEGESDKPVVSDQELAAWLKTSTENTSLLEERRKTMMAVVLVTVNLECMHRFFANHSIIKKLGESIHYMFRHGYIKQACEISQVELPNIISYLGILHENRLGQSILHNSLKAQAKREYVRDVIYLFLVYTWQTAMGIWQQCLEDSNLKVLSKNLQKIKKDLWTSFNELVTASTLADVIFPEKLKETLQNGLPDFVSQSMMQNFRNFLLERSGILPATCNAFPTDFIPISYKECPPPLWTQTYLLHLANYLMYHTDTAFDMTSDGLLKCHCRCNLCTPHRSLVFNNALLNETQSIGTFELQGPPNEQGVSPAPLKLTPAVWTSAYLRKFEPKDYHPFEIKFFEDQSKRIHQELTPCVITQSNIIAQLQEIRKAREDFLLKKGQGVYLDPHTGERLNGPHPTAASNGSQNAQKSAILSTCSSSNESETSGARIGGRKQSGESGGGRNPRLSRSSSSSGP
ncbi:100K [Egyptian fruit bat adenovirus]|uniref:Shutoff protein n=1 Tax=Egyptian fruit bat adenovirus TaxID=2849732 RepID=A0A344X9V4_9ADEN|nr:100K [Rousettus aegyptiacus adenovirus]AXE75636.1 100K [Egyptian fruit bat adenovirus]